MSNLRVGAIDSTNGNNAISVAADGKSTFTSPPVNVGMTHVGSITVADGSAAIGALHINGVFSANYDYYKVFYRVVRPGASSEDVLAVRFGNGSVIISDGTAVRGKMFYDQLGQETTSGRFWWYSSKGIHQLHGTIDGGAGPMFQGELTVHNPFSSTIPTSINSHCVMFQSTAQSEVSKWTEDAGSSEDWGDATSATDMRFVIISGSGGGSDVSYTNSMAAVSGNFTVFGVKS
tara:strand:- start:445 stop:1143 length:699 start_codon:yes stop_codon:yes gene_type:complete